MTCCYGGSITIVLQTWTSSPAVSGPDSSWIGISGNGTLMTESLVLLPTVHAVALPSLKYNISAPGHFPFEDQASIHMPLADTHWSSHYKVQKSSFPLQLASKIVFSRLLELGTGQLSALLHTTRAKCHAGLE